MVRLVYPFLAFAINLGGLPPPNIGFFLPGFLCYHFER